MFSKLYIRAVMLQKGTLAHFWKNIYMYIFLAWCDLFYICRLPFHKVYTTEKTALYWFHFRSFFNSLHKPFLLSDKKKHGPEKKMPLWHFVTNYFSCSRFLCYLTANACNSRVLRLQNEFPYLNENYQTDERDTFRYVLGVVNRASSNVKVTTFSFLVLSFYVSLFLLLIVHIFCCDSYTGHTT